VFRRFLFYLVGVGFGILVSLFFFGDRDIDFSYLPNARAVKHLRSQKFDFSNIALCNLECLGLSPSSFEEMFQTAELDIDFSSSDVQSHCREYHISSEEIDLIKFQIQDCDSTSKLIEIELSNCDCL
tara:strand:- start:350 stop:730 length:381 start_codon:yes stop_codon:yes gene_type:complete